MKTQTNSRKYEGQCKFCQGDFTKKDIASHLAVCPKRKGSAKVKNLRLRISDPYQKNFWLIIEVNEQAKLKDLDNLIRDVWVECCGHLSSFGGYGGEVGKGRCIIETLKPAEALNYTYDFGSSTELVVEALEYSNCQLSGKGKVELVARNYLPLSNCLKCGEQATFVCAACSEEEEKSVLVCEKCAEKYHNEENEEEDHYGLPLANSPRSGVCGYEPPEPLDKLF
ncbi:hypothetical protein COU05_03995 [bacterium (Candidatus Gribaldobacteria) CG10_big_fil_rev_8_21_14_0_10_37_21]|uniref:Uncharacterized protein n=1 Tax=bacterium (Candidatus Gribaldobacteria) CG10_big_fil_rev_8_21_14_0_10_37_21 TaxID=2014275 RepID=A0A2H0UTB9_9BACT|nr:MAG: hypothetical protein COU05_03995 [bacterium (Candidatus Gribaldobacteria) CG10_big_fil_rev_8_21_14_0_10_37_21]